MVRILLSLPDSYLRLALFLEDSIGCLLIIYLMQRLTPHACFTGAPEARWAMMRRLVYANGALCLGVKGFWRFEVPFPVTWLEFATQSGIIFSLVAFSVMRAIGMITQDELRTR